MAFRRAQQSAHTISIPTQILAPVLEHVEPIRKRPALALCFGQRGLQALYFLLGVRNGTCKCLFALYHLLFLAASRTKECTFLNQACLQHALRLLGLSNNLSP